MIYKNQNTMRKGILLIFTMLATLIGCGQYDDSELKSDINDLKSRMAALEKQCKNMNENLTSLQAIVDAIQKQDASSASLTCRTVRAIPSSSSPAR